MGAFTIILLALITAGLGVLFFRRQTKSQLSTAGRIPPARKTSKARTKAARQISTQRAQHSQRQKITSPGNPFRAVSIVCAKEHCMAAKSLAGKFYLVEDEDVPTLPLPACDLSKCGCRYSHHTDRRQYESDRRTISGMQTEMHQHNGNEERRARNTRRKTD